jgi:hypothetical protein
MLVVARPGERGPATRRFLCFGIQELTEIFAWAREEGWTAVLLYESPKIRHDPPFWQFLR